LDDENVYVWDRPEYSPELNQIEGLGSRMLSIKDVKKITTRDQLWKNLEELFLSE
jgi:transposase